MRSLFRSGLLAFVFVPALCAQQGTTSEKDRIQREIEAQKEQMRQGSLVRVNVRVTVRLKNQNKLVGVVKNGRFVERSEGLDFVEADRKTAGAGIRVWYYDGTTSCIFLPYDDIETYTIGQRLSEAQVKAIEERLEAERKRAEDAREAQRRKETTDEKTGSSKGDKDKEKPAGGNPEQGAETKNDGILTSKHKEALALVQEFPPEKGWGPEKAAEIEKRKITLGVYPNSAEKRFLQVLEDWKRGVALAKELEAKKAAPSK